LSVSGRPAPLFIRRVGFRYAFQVFALNPFDTTAFDKDIQRATTIPNPCGGFIGTVGLDASASDEINPDRLDWRALWSNLADGFRLNCRRRRRTFLDFLNSFARYEAGNSTTLIPNSLLCFMRVG